MHPRCHNPPHIQTPVLDFDGYAAHLWRDVLDVSVCEVQSLVILVSVPLRIACSVHEHPARTLVAQVYLHSLTSTCNQSALIYSCKPSNMLFGKAHALDTATDLPPHTPPQLLVQRFMPMASAAHGVAKRRSAHVQADKDYYMRGGSGSMQHILYTGTLPEVDNNRTPYAKAEEHHSEFVMGRVAFEEACECSSCVVFKLTYDVDKGKWTSNTRQAAVGVFALFIEMTFFITHPKQCVPSFLTDLLQSGALLVQRENGPPTPHQQDSAFVFNTHLRQIYVSTWSVMCMLCMIVIAGVFVMQRGKDEFRPYMGGLQPRVVAGPPPVVSGQSLASLSLHMSKGTAMVLVFVYTAAAWTMSNGIILNPVRNGSSITH
jgi:hypothetical protein